MWRTGSALGANAAATSAACTERFPERTTEQIEDIPLPQASVSQVTGSLPRLDESDAPVYHQVRQEQIAAGETTQNMVDIQTVQEQVIVQGIPEVQVVKLVQKQIVEAIEVNPLERVQQRAVEQSVSLFERFDEFGKRLEMSLARRSENEKMIKLEVYWKKNVSRKSSIRRSSIIFNMSLVPMESTNSSHHGRVA